MRRQIIFIALVALLVSSESFAISITAGYASKNTVLAVFSEAANSGDAANVANYTVESPIGIPVNLSGATVKYQNKKVSITGLNFKNKNSFKIVVRNVRDLSNNIIIDDGVTNAATGIV